MRAVIAASMLVLLAAPAAAQMSAGRGGRAEDSGVEKQYQQRLKDQAEIDKQYQATIKQTGKGAATGPADPWASVRPATPAPAPAKPTTEKVSKAQRNPK